MSNKNCYEESIHYIRLENANTTINFKRPIQNAVGYRVRNVFSNLFISKAIQIFTGGLSAFHRESCTNNGVQRSIIYTGFCNDYSQKSPIFWSETPCNINIIHFTTAETNTIESFPLSGGDDPNYIFVELGIFTKTK